MNNNNFKTLIEKRKFLYLEENVTLGKDSNKSKRKFFMAGAVVAKEKRKTQVVDIISGISECSRGLISDYKQST